jgi:hypothetical protein
VSLLHIIAGGCQDHAVGTVAGPEGILTGPRQAISPIYQHASLGLTRAALL